MNNRLKALKIEIKRVGNDIATLMPKRVSVSDHAVLRYAERHLGLQLEDVRKQIEEVLGPLPAYGDVKALGFVVKDGVVVTYAPRSAFIGEEKQ